jgi:carboxylesterase
MGLDFAQFFQGDEHLPFLLEGGEAAVLLIHGFPGTPSETRPLGEVLHAAGLTVRGLLLPGFGPDINSLPWRRREEWLEAVIGELRDLQSRHHPVFLGGFSMGAALALAAAAIEQPDGLLLLAPFWRLKGAVWSLLPLIRRFVPTFKPFRFIKLDFSDPRMRRGMAEFMPGLNLEDPEVQRGIREFAVPVAMIDELRKTGQLAGKFASRVNIPTLVIQGLQDELVRKDMTVQLVERLSGPVTYREVDAAHDLLEPERPAWTLIQEVVVEFIRQSWVPPDPAPAPIPVKDLQPGRIVTPSTMGGKS